MNNLIKIQVEGHRTSNYLKWLFKEKINIYSINIINSKKIELLIDYKNLSKIKKYSKLYKITIIKKYGKIRIKEIIKNNIFIFISIIFSIIFIYFLSNIIFNVNVIYNDNKITEKIYQELESYNIKKYQFKKTKEYLNYVEAEILNNNKDILEWIEIIETGTTYNIKLVERKKPEKEEEYIYQSIVASKKATITKIVAYNGEKIKDIGEYVTQDEIIISGIITKPSGEIIYNKAKGKIYGTVWYKVNIEYPLYYQEEKVTGKNKNILILNFLDKKIPLLPYKKYKQFNSSSTIIFENKIVPLTISKENIYEVIVKEKIYTEEEAVNIAISLAKNKIKENNSKIIAVNEIKILSKENLNSKIKLSLFVSVTEDITKIIEIKEEINN